MFFDKLRAKKLSSSQAEGELSFGSADEEETSPPAAPEPHKPKLSSAKAAEAASPVQKEDLQEEVPEEGGFDLGFTLEKTSEIRLETPPQAQAPLPSKAPIAAKVPEPEMQMPSADTLAQWNNNAIELSLSLDEPREDLPSPHSSRTQPAAEIPSGGIAISSFDSFSNADSLDLQSSDVTKPFQQLESEMAMTNVDMPSVELKLDTPAAADWNAQLYGDAPEVTLEASLQNSAPALGELPTPFPRAEIALGEELSLGGYGNATVAVTPPSLAQNLAQAEEDYPAISVEYDEDRGHTQLVENRQDLENLESASLGTSDLDRFNGYPGSDVPDLNLDSLQSLSLADSASISEVLKGLQTGSSMPPPITMQEMSRPPPSPEMQDPKLAPPSSGNEKQPAPQPLGSESAGLSMAEQPPESKSEVDSQEAAKSRWQNVLSKFKGVPAASKMKSKKAKSIATAIATVAVVASVGYYLFSGDDKENSEAIQTAQNNSAGEKPAGGLNAKPGDSSKGKPDGSGTEKKGAPGKKAESAGGAMAVNSPNGAYWTEIESAIAKGEANLAVAKFKLPLPQPLADTEQFVAKEMEGRFYLLMSSLPKAKVTLEKACPKKMTTFSSGCLHYIRALISNGDYQTAREQLKKIEEGAEELASYRTEINLLRISLEAVSSPKSANVIALLDCYLKEVTMNMEWLRQRNTWLVRAVWSMQPAERIKFVRFVFGTKAKEYSAAFQPKSESAADPSLEEAFLSNFFHHLAVEYEMPPLLINLGRIKRELDTSLMAAVFSMLNRSYIEPAATVMSFATVLRGKAVYGEIREIIAARLALQDGDTGTVAQMLAERPKRFGADFEFEWTMTQAYFSMLIGNQDEMKKSYQLLQLAVKKEPALLDDFHFWYLQVKLLRELKRDFSVPLQRMRVLAATPKEFGFVYMEEAYLLKLQNKPVSAINKLKEAITKIPYHPPLLQSAAEIVGQLGGDPTPYIEMQSGIPDRFLRRSQEIPPLINLTIKKLVKAL
jgi:hypothetical protein